MNSPRHCNKAFMIDTTGSRLVGFYREISNTDVRHIATEPLRPAVQLHKRRIACICCKSLRCWSSARLDVTYLKLSVKHPQVSGSSSLWISVDQYYEYVCVIMNMYVWSDQIFIVIITISSGVRDWPMVTQEINSIAELTGNKLQLFTVSCQRSS